MKKLLNISDCSKYPVCHLVSLCSCCLSKMWRRSWMRRRRLLNISGLVITVVIMLLLYLNNCTYNVLDNVENVKMYLYQQFPLVTLTSYILRELWTTQNVLWSLTSVCVCVSTAVRPHCTDPDVTWGRGRGCPLVVHYWADLQSCASGVAMAT